MVTENMYSIERNGVLIAAVLGTNLGYEDHNRPKNSVDTYTITASNTQGQVSPSVTVTVQP